MKKFTTFVGLDVHADTIAAAIAEKDGEVRSIGTFANRPEAVRKFIKKLGDRKKFAVCYEAGPTGFALYWLLTGLGVYCEVVAPTLVPKKAGDKVKTDRRDALLLARGYRAGDLSVVWVPDAEHEALRELVRCREAAKADQLRARHRLSKLLLRHGIRPPKGIKNWSKRHELWLQTVRFEQPPLEAVRRDLWNQVKHQTARIEQLEADIDEAVANAPDHLRALIAGLQALRGVAKLTATTIATEVGDISRFQSPRQLMSYSGLCPREYSSGSRTSKGGITKSGNAHLRRVLIESSWSYRYPPNIYPVLRKRQEGASDAVKEISWKAQHRLHRRYRALTGRGKTPTHAATVVGRELLGFVWAIAKEVAEEKPLKTVQSKRRRAA